MGRMYQNVHLPLTDSTNYSREIWLGEGRGGGEREKKILCRQNAVKALMETL